METTREPETYITIARSKALTILDTLKLAYIAVDPLTHPANKRIENKIKEAIHLLETCHQ